MLKNTTKDNNSNYKQQRLEDLAVVSQEQSSSLFCLELLP